MRIRGRLGALIALIVVAAGVPVLAVTTSTSAATADLQFSIDGGGAWSSTPPTAVFEEALRVVPGDRLEKTVLVRSTRSSPTVLMVAITNASVNDTVFDEAITVQGDDGTGAGLAATRLSALAECDAVVPTRTVLAGQTVPVTLAVDISPSLAGHQAENAVARFDLEIGLTDPGAPTTPNGCPVDPAVIAGFALPGSAPAAIAYTGAGLVAPTLGVAALALAAGGLLTLASRRRRERAVRR